MNGGDKESRLRKTLLMIAGAVCVGLGTAGIFLPLLPTTPFLLLAATCYARSSPRRLRRLLANRWYGAYLGDYRAGRGIPGRVKAGALVLLWITIALSIVFATSLLWVRVLLGTIAIAVTLHILMLPTTKKVEELKS
ncbi:MAG: YbaN family protein [Acidobacteriota bacterium]|jgi:uncharacterized membrane protein YbaN (DUF454 family)|nr:YbaN family protein [Acidobacteriota bacterium]